MELLNRDPGRTYDRSMLATVALARYPLYRWIPIFVGFPEGLVSVDGRLVVINDVLEVTGGNDLVFWNLVRYEGA